MQNGFIYLTAILCCASPCFGQGAEETHQKLQFAYKLSLEEVDESTLEKQEALRLKYAGALDKLEADIQAAGDLAGLLEIRNEKKAVESPGKVSKTKFKTARLTKLRDVYRTSLASIEAGREAAKRQKAETYSEQLPAVIESLTREDKLDAAVAAQEELKKLQALASSSDAKSSSGKVRLVRIPTTRPAVDAKAKDKTDWLESITVPKGNYAIEKSKDLGKSKEGGTWYLAMGSVFTGAGKYFHLRGGRLIAESCEFRQVPIRAGWNCSSYFIDCKLTGSSVQRKDTWYGHGLYDTKWYFENCEISDDLVSGDINLFYFGLCMSRCTLKDVELPSIYYKKKEPASRVKDTWVTVTGCKFDNCRVPLSFLLATRDCLFINCRFEDDKKVENTINDPIEVTYYTSGCTDMFNKTPDAVRLKEISATKLSTPVGTFSR